MNRTARRRPLGRRTVVFCPTAFKGTLSPAQAAALMAREAARRRPDWRRIVLPVADGGDGTLEVLVSAWSGRRLATRVVGPLGEPTRAAWGWSDRSPLGSRVAVIEMARASGLALTNGRNRVMEATSRGTGELVRAALDRGARTIVIGVGGTATAEAGAGALAVLGARFEDRAGNLLPPTLAGLLRVHRVDTTGLDPRLRRARLFIVCDVTNPLCGPRGSARTFAPQKGATPAEVRTIETALRRLARCGPAGADRAPGAGAAGALAYGFSAFAGARLVEGAAFIFRALGWPRRIARADLLVTGEGRLDETTFGGKAAGEVLRQRGSAAVAVVCGSTALSESAWRRRGIADIEMLGPVGLRRPTGALRHATARLLSRWTEPSTDRRRSAGRIEN